MYKALRFLQCTYVHVLYCGSVCYSWWQLRTGTMSWSHPVDHGCGWLVLTTSLPSSSPQPLQLEDVSYTKYYIHVHAWVFFSYSESYEQLFMYLQLLNNGNQALGYVNGKNVYSTLAKRKKKEKPTSPTHTRQTIHYTRVERHQIPIAWGWWVSHIHFMYTNMLRNVILTWQLQ